MIIFVVLTFFIILELLGLIKKQIIYNQHRSDGKTHAVDRIHLNLADVGEVKGEFPQHFNYSFEAGALKYDVKVRHVCLFVVSASVSIMFGSDDVNFR